MRLHFLVLFLFCFNTLRSEEAGSYPLADSSIVSVPETEQVLLEEYRQDKAFQYQRTSIDTFSIWMKLKSLFQRFSEDIAFVIGGLPVLFRILLWGAIVILLVVVFTKSSLYRVYASKKKIQSPDFNIRQPYEEGVDTDSLILDAEEQQQFRLAIRYRFLRIVEHLDETNLIVYSREKTNSHYLEELKRNTSLADNFLQLVNIYNMVWYGIHEIDRRTYEIHQKKFLTFLHAQDVKE